MNLPSVIGVFLRLVVIEAYSLSRCLWVWRWGHHVELFTAVPYLLVLRAMSVDAVTWGCNPSILSIMQAAQEPRI